MGITLKNITVIMIIGFVIISGFGTISTLHGETIKKTYHEIQTFSQPQIIQTGRFSTIDCNEATSLLICSGKPMLPVFTKVITLPIGSRIIDINVKFSNPVEIPIIKEIQGI